MPFSISNSLIWLISELFPLLNFSSCVLNPGVTIHSSSTFTRHNSNLTRFTYFHLKRLRVIRCSAVSLANFTTLVNFSIFVRIKYCNSFSCGSSLSSWVDTQRSCYAESPYSDVFAFIVDELH